MTTPQSVQQAATAVRPRWDELPAPLRDGLAELLGEITTVEIQGGGFTPGLAARIQLADGERVFAKGIPAAHPLAGKYRDEAATTRRLPAATPAPRLRWDGQIADWVVLVLDDLDARHVDLSPGSPDASRVVAMVAGLADVLTPCPIDAPAAELELADLVHGWDALAEASAADLDEWTRRHLSDLAALETDWLAAAGGTTLVHGDVNASNLLIDRAEGVCLIDWAQPVRGATWLDVVDLVPHLILAGHTPAEAEAVLADVPAWRDTAPAVITSYAAAFAGYWERSSLRPAPPGVPYLRAHQARAARAAIAWTMHRTGWA
ncbi:phosphotransferase [Actinoallomurus purpureus]|uniref:phosphotransferase n=1 Tax=Actinoallomurus purpureus TaxID=478114 RepID=UPI0020924264|nr:phosphotransferase [Actinoallomurus purpureus]MCO6008617.1 phosphotransferase [Actinoallomurus purpureus]